MLYEPDSDVIDFYPSNLKLDVNGARYAWMGVNLLPFIDRERLKRAMTIADKNYDLLSTKEKERNRVTGEIYLFFKHSEKNRDSKL